jgi:hypothetical protein
VQICQLLVREAVQQILEEAVPLVEKALEEVLVLVA